MVTVTTRPACVMGVAVEATEWTVAVGLYGEAEGCGEQRGGYGADGDRSAGRVDVVHGGRDGGRAVVSGDGRRPGDRQVDDGVGVGGSGRVVGGRHGHGDDPAGVRDGGGGGGDGVDGRGVLD